jgi:ubiquinone biosynthesis monooxygenase Coq7
MMPRQPERKPKPAARSAQPGRTKTDTIEEILRVDHAGEYGAVRIYSGQLAVYKYLAGKQDTVESLTRMAKEEEVHLARFTDIINERGVRPTAFAPIWHVAGFALGAATALMGEKAAHACTEAVEDVIDEHYAQQVKKLDAMGTEESDLRETIERFRLEEVQHRDEAIEKGAKEAPGYTLLSGVIRAGCKIAIKLSEKV